MGLNSIWTLLKQTYHKWREDQAARLAAALAYYSAVSIAPLVVIVIAIVALVYGETMAEQQLIKQMENIMGTQGAAFIQTVIENANRPGVGGIASLLSLAVLLWGSTNLFTELQSTLNVIWDAEHKTESGVMAMIKDRLLSFGMVLGIGFLMLVSLVLSAVLVTIGNSFSNFLPGGAALWEAVNFAISFSVTALLFALIFKFMPDAPIAWRDVWVGATITAVLFTTGKFVLGLYLGNQGSAYGAAGSLVVFLLWVYYSAQILFFGAEFTQVYSTQNTPEARAVRDRRNRQPSQETAGNT